LFFLEQERNEQGKVYFVLLSRIKCLVLLEQEMNDHGKCLVLFEQKLHEQD
jgi:hypothetical protein